MMGKKNENPIPKIDRFFAEEPKASLETNKKEESKRSRTAFGMTRNRSEQQIKNLMNNCEDFRANITNISKDIRGMETNIKSTDTLKKKLEEHDEIVWSDKFVI